MQIRGVGWGGAWPDVGPLSEWRTRAGRPATCANDSFVGRDPAWPLSKSGVLAPRGPARRQLLLGYRWPVSVAKGASSNLHPNVTKTGLVTPHDPSPRLHFSGSFPSPHPHAFAFPLAPLAPTPHRLSTLCPQSGRL
jgi:hypothetical protein